MCESQPSSQNARRLVLVADEPMLHRIVARVLGGFDLVPLLTADGAAAIAAVEARQSELCGAILGVAMPGIDGIDAAQVIQRLVPNMPIILMSGALPGDFAVRTAGLRLAGTLPKPFSPAALRELIQQAFVDGILPA